MKLAKFKTYVLRVPVTESLANGPVAAGHTHDYVALQLTTDSGIEGIGLTRYGGGLTKALRVALDQLCELAMGSDPLKIEAIVAKLRAAAGSSGPGGIFTLAMAALDIALWDIKGKHLNVPLATLLGGFRNKVPAYASAALRREFPLEHLIEAGPRLVEKGFKQMKMQLALFGDTTPAKEVERTRLLREAVGDGIDLMCDINQRWDVRQAISIGHQIEQYNLFWLEDIVAHDDYKGWARAAAALATPIAGSECVYGLVPFRHMLEMGSVDIVMIDLCRAGGITQWTKIAAMAEAFNLPVVSHLFPEINVHTVAAIPNGLTVEYVPWTTELFEETPPVKDGFLTVPTSPGLGLKFDEQVLKRLSA